MKTLKLTLIAAALASVAAGAVAQTTTPPPAAQSPAPQRNAPETAQPDQPRQMHRLDANNDGSVDEQEFATVQNLKDADANNDGTLSTEELGQMILKRQAERRAARLSNRLDVDGDGTVTLAEIEKNRAERFALLDRNDDGKLEDDELGRGGRHDGERRVERNDDDQRGDHGRQGHDRYDRNDDNGGDHDRRGGRGGDERLEFEL